MTSKNPIRIAVTLAATLALIGCGGSGSGPAGSQTTAAVGSAGATLTTGGATLSIPAGALAAETQITLREAEPRHAGRLARVEMEPKDLALAKTAQLSVRVDDSNVKVKMIHIEDEVEHMGEVEVEDRNHHMFKTSVDKLGEVEVELEHGLACDTACSAAEECDDGMCKPHEEDEDAQACSTMCDPGLECEDGGCKPHGGADDPAGSVTCAPACATGLECDASDGICKPHGGGN